MSIGRTRARSQNPLVGAVASVSGDVHGCFQMRTDATEAIQFEPECVRLFAFGDLLSCGLNAREAIDCLERPSIHREPSTR